MTRTSPLSHLLAIFSLCASVALATPSAEDVLVKRIGDYHAYTGGHVRRVGEYAAFLARALRLPAAEVERCHSAGRLHDLGKLEVPVALLDKPGKLSDDEWKVIKKHPARGDQLAAGIEPAVHAGIVGHHERWDGAGYPTGLKGDAIPLIARIVSVADVWDAVTTTRSYQKQRSFTEACAILRKAAGSQLDPKLVDAFLADPRALEALARKLEEH